MKAVDHLIRVTRENDSFTSEVMKRFNESWNQGYGKELSRTTLLRKIMRELSDEEMDRAIRAFNDDKKLELINSEGDIDRPINLAVKLLKMDPSILMLVPRYLPLLRKLI